MKLRLVLFLLVAALLVGLGGCGKSVEAEPSAAGAPRKPADTSAKYVGAWRAKDATLVIKREGAAFIMETEGPGGSKEVGALENGVLRFGFQSALYTPSNDRLVFASKEYRRIDSQQQTIHDLEGIGQAIQVYTRQNEYKIPPVNDIDFFVGLPKVYPEMSRQDGWGTRYRYLYKLNGPHWAVVSAGPDGVFDPVLTEEMVAMGMIGTRGDDIVMVDGVVTSGVSSRGSAGRAHTGSKRDGTNTQPFAADLAKPAFRYLGTFESPNNLQDRAQIELYRNGETQLVGRLLYPVMQVDSPHCRLDGTYEPATGKVVVRGLITQVDDNISRQIIYVFVGTWRPERLTGELTENSAQRKPIKHSLTLNRRRDVDSYGEAITSLEDWERR